MGSLVQFSMLLVLQFQEGQKTYDADIVIRELKSGDYVFEKCNKKQFLQSMVGFNAICMSGPVLTY